MSNRRYPKVWVEASSRQAAKKSSRVIESFSLREIIEARPKTSKQNFQIPLWIAKTGEDYTYRTRLVPSCSQQSARAMKRIPLRCSGIPNISKLYHCTESFRCRPAYYWRLILKLYILCLLFMVGSKPFFNEVVNGAPQLWRWTSSSRRHITKTNDHLAQSTLVLRVLEQRFEWHAHEHMNSEHIRITPPSPVFPPTLLSSVWRQTVIPAELNQQSPTKTHRPKPTLFKESYISCDVLIEKGNKAYTEECHRPQPPQLPLRSLTKPNVTSKHLRRKH